MKTWFSGLIAALLLTLAGCGGSTAIPDDFGPEPVNAPPAVPVTGAYVGALLLTGQTSITDFNLAIGVRHAAFGEFLKFPELLDTSGDEYRKLKQFILDCRAAAAIPVIVIETMGGLGSYTDQQVIDFAEMLYGFHTALVLRWDHEMNGSWYPWGQQPIEYIARFQAFAQVVHERAPNVAIAWTPNQGWGYPWAGGAYSAQPGTPDFAALDTNGDGQLTDADDPYGPYYPGDAYVDWVGFSFYHWSNIPDRGYNQVPYDMKWAQVNGIGNPVPNFHDIFAVGHDKPMMVAETSAFYDPADRNGGGAEEAAIKQAWIDQVYNLTDPDNVKINEAFPKIHLICWFSQLKPEAEVGGDVDWRVHLNPAVVSYYSSVISNPYFIKAP